MMIANNPFRKPKKIPLNIHVERVRNRHLNEMKRHEQMMRSRKHDKETRDNHREIYEEMKHDLLEYDSWFLDAKYKIIDDEKSSTHNAKSKGLYIVCMENGTAYKSYRHAADILGINRDAIRYSIVKPEGDVDGLHFRMVDESIIYPEEE